MLDGIFNIFYMEKIKQSLFEKVKGWSSLKIRQFDEN